MLDGGFELADLRRIDPVAEGRVDDDGDVLGGEPPVLLQEGLDRLVQLGEAG